MIWHHVGDLSALAERAWSGLLAADNSLAVESMKRTVAEMKADLAGAQPSRLERMLVDEVVASWIEVKYLETVSTSQGNASLDQASFKLKRLESAKRRHLTAIKTLANVRSLMPAGLAPVPFPRLHEEPNKERACRGLVCLMRTGRSGKSYVNSGIDGNRLR